MCTDLSRVSFGSPGTARGVDYVKRQKHNQFYFGDGAYQRGKIAELIGKAA